MVAMETLAKDGKISVQPGSAEGADFLRTRLALTGAALFGMSAGFLVLANLLGVAQLGFSWRDELHRPGNLAHLGQLVVFALTWLVCRTTRPSLRALEWLDACSIVAVCACHAAIAYTSPSGSHPGLDIGGLVGPNPPSAATANVVALVARAILIPSGPVRTLVVTSLAAAPMIGASFALEHQHPGAASLSFFFGAVLWSLLSIGLATLASGVVYRLERRAREARALGQYKLEGRIGEGGMGVVYRARHAILQRPTAVKVLPREKAGDRALARFEREVQATSRLSHPNTISIYDYGRTPEGVFYYAMELLDGVDLDRLVRRAGPLPAARVVHVLLQVCGALAEAHEAGLVHRDIKPANVFLCRQGGMFDVAKVLDFGLVRELATSGDLTQDGAEGVIGTPFYISPESISHPGQVDGRSDLYSLGCTAHFLLTGRTPFEGASVVEVCAKHLSAPFDLEPLRGATAAAPGLAEIVAACMEKQPAARPASARELASRLRAAAVAAPWSDDDARRWWSSHPETAAPVVEDAGLAPTVIHLDVDLSGRFRT